jgi:hypothetical protein
MTTIHDPAFDAPLTLRDAYRAMERFVQTHYARGETSTLEFLTYVGLTDDGRTGDPAALEDFLRAVRDTSNA